MRHNTETADTVVLRCLTDASTVAAEAAADAVNAFILDATDAEDAAADAALTDEAASLSPMEFKRPC